MVIFTYARKSVGKLTVDISPPTLYPYLEVSVVGGEQI